MDVAILAAARFPIREPFAGGMEAHTHALAERLWARGHDVTVYAAGGDGPYGVHRMLPVDFEASTVARRDVSSGPASALAEHHSYLDAVLEVGRRRHQIVHINAVHHLPFACAGLWTSSVVTATLHSPPTPWLESAVRLAEARPRRASDGLGIACQRPGVAGRADRSGDPQRHRSAAVAARARRASAAWWGRVVPEKAPHLAIDAARRAGMAITVMGPVHDEAYFEREVRPRLGGEARYAGHLATADVAAEVGRSNVAVITPAWDEPFGLVVAEALACGTPIAAFDRGAMAELIDSSTGRVVPAGDVVRLAAAIEEATSCDREECRRQAEHRFSSDTMADGYESWFQTLLAARGAEER